MTRYHLPKAFLRILGQTGIKSLNALVLLCVLFANFTGVAQARPENKQAPEALPQESQSVTVKDVYNSPSFTHPEPRVGRATGDGDNTIAQYDDSLILVSPAITYLSDLDWISATNGWGPQYPTKDLSNDQHPIILNGVTYTKGLGAHAFSTIYYDLNAAYSLFISDVGLDDEADVCGATGTVGFQVFVDGI